MSITSTKCAKCGKDLRYRSAYHPGGLDVDAVYISKLLCKACYLIYLEEKGLETVAKETVATEHP